MSGADPCRAHDNALHVVRAHDRIRALEFENASLRSGDRIQNYVAWKARHDLTVRLVDAERLLREVAAANPSGLSLKQVCDDFERFRRWVQEHCALLEPSAYLHAGGNIFTAFAGGRDSGAKLASRKARSTSEVQGAATANPSGGNCLDPRHGHDHSCPTCGYRVPVVANDLRRRSAEDPSGPTLDEDGRETTASLRRREAAEAENPSGEDQERGT